MKKLIPFLSLIILASCGEKGNTEKAEPGNILENLTYTVDTIVIDSGEELFNLSGMIHLASQPPNLVYLFDEKQARIQKVDLERKIITETFQFEKEGPNGTGTSLSNFQSLADDRFLIVTNEAQGIFRPDGTKELDLLLSTFSELENDTQTDLQIPFEMQVSSDGRLAFALVGDFFEGLWDFVRIDLEGKSLRTWEMPELLSSRNFTIMLMSDEDFDLRAEDIHLNTLNDKVVVTAGNTSSAYIYDPASDSLDLVSFPHRITAIEKTGIYPLEVNSKKAYDDVISEINSEITYGSFVWDSSRDMFFRLGDKNTGDKKSEAFLYAYDKELKLIGEQKIEGLEKMPSHYFFKDGKLYSYVNVEDELGFAVFTFDF